MVKTLNSLTFISLEFSTWSFKENFQIFCTIISIITKDFHTGIKYNECCFIRINVCHNYFLNILFLLLDIYLNQKRSLPSLSRIFIKFPLTDFLNRQHIQMAPSVPQVSPNFRKNNLEKYWVVGQNPHPFMGNPDRPL